MLIAAKRWLLRSALGKPVRWLSQRLWPHAHLDRNERYDRETLDVIARVLPADGNAVDVGAHAGSILRAIVSQAPLGQHWAFEPIPSHAARLQAEFPRVSVHQVALAATPGISTFQHVVSNPAYSGLKRRAYPKAETIELLTVRTARLDNILESDVPIAFVKIDVEGGELGVFRGATRTLRRWRPIVVFEFGLGAADYYGTEPEEISALLADCGLAVTLMRRWLHGRRAFTPTEFARCYRSGEEFYYLACPAEPGEVGYPEQP